MSDIRIGISGWRYGPWRKDFYPKGLPQDDELAFASRAVNSIEINGSFYSLQTPERYQGWHDQTPPGFVFAVKAPRYITHVRRLKDIEEAVANFFASGPLLLGKKLGPFLWQFPPNMKFDEARFARAYVASRLARRAEGPASLAAALRARGVDEETARAAIAALLDPEARRAALGRAWATELKKAKGDPAAARSRLRALGFSSSEISAYREETEA